MNVNYTDSRVKRISPQRLSLTKKARQRKLKGGSDTFVYDDEVLHYYQVLSHSLLTAMDLKY
jgi:hypothetical protein